MNAETRLPLRMPLRMSLRLPLRMPLRMSLRMSITMPIKQLICGALLLGAISSAHALPDVQQSPLQPFEPLRFPMGDPLRTLPSQSLQNPAAPVPEDCSAARQPLVWSEGKILTLAEALDRGLCRNPRVQSAWAAIKKSAAGFGQAKSALLPKASASVARNSQRDQYINSPEQDSYMAVTIGQLSISYRLLDSGVTNSRSDSAEWDLEAALYAYDVSLLEALLNTISTYYDALANQATAESASLASKVAQDLYQTALRREKGGAGNHNETLQAETAWLRAELDFKKSANEQLKSQALLRYHLGENTIEKQAFVLVDEGISNELSTEELDHWYELALQVHPLLRQSTASVQSAIARLRATERDHWPTVDVGATYNRSFTPSATLSGGALQQDEYILGITLNIPVIFDGFNWNYRILEARSQLEQAQSDATEVQSRILGDVTRGYHDLRTLQSSLETTAQLQSAAEASHQSALNRLKRGAADISEVLNAQKALSDARRDRIQNLSNWRAARLKLRVQTGILERLAQQHSTSALQ